MNRRAEASYTRVSVKRSQAVRVGPERDTMGGRCARALYREELRTRASVTPRRTNLVQEGGFIRANRARHERQPKNRAHNVCLGD